MVFENVFCTNSICTPSRASILTGQYSHRNGVYDLYDSLAGEQHYLPREMQKAGDTTAVVSKWHLKESPKFFDYYSVIAGQGSYMNPTMHISEGGEKRRVRFDSTLVRETEVKDYEGHSSDVLTDITLDWLRKRDKTKPFFLMHHFKAPHDMFVYAKRYNRDRQTTLDILAPERRQLSGREAHETVERILEETVDLALWEALLIDQGERIGLTDLKESIGLARALDEAAGAADGSAGAGGEDGSLFASVQREYESYFTPSKGDPRYSAFEQARDDAAAVLEFRRT